MAMFRSVRAKLMALVGLSLALMVVMIPLLSWLLYDELLSLVNQRVQDAEKFFQLQLVDDWADLRLTVDNLAKDPPVLSALKSGGREVLEERANDFMAAYPEVDVMFADASGHIIAQRGCDAPVARVQDIPELAARGSRFEGVVAHGCSSKETGAPPAEVVSQVLEGVGSVMAFHPMSQEHLVNDTKKIGVELAVFRPGGVRIAKTDHFPDEETGALSGKAQIVSTGGRMWVAQRFEPKELEGPSGRYAVIAAIDITEVREAAVRDALIALALLLLVGGGALFLGMRLAGTMSRALGKVNQALRKLEKHEYVHVDPVRTGDELEDLAEGFNHMVDGLRERDKLKNTLGKYMTEAVVDHLLSGKLQLGGETLPVTVLFTDIRGFTSISEKMDAQGLVKVLNEFFGEMVTIVMEEDGVVDKFIGDAIMAVFGAPVPKPDDAVHAVRAAVRMQQKVEELSRSVEARGLPPVRMGVGIHTGEVVAGNIGSEKRMEYTVIGDTVNLASRLESSTKELGVNILVSEATYELVKDVVEARPVRELTVRGRGQAVMTYEILALKGRASLIPNPVPPLRLQPEA